MADTNKPSFPKTYTIGGDLTLNRMGYGAMRITGEGIWGPPKDRDEAIRVLKRAVELGINFIDTADSYGPDVSEKLIAEALHPYPKDLLIATKGGFTRSGPGEWHVNAHPDHLRKVLHGSLERLKCDRIDLYQLHRVDPDVPYEKTLEFLQQVQEEGLVKHIGLSEVNVEQIKKAQEYVKVVSVQNKYSVDFRDWEEELDYCRAQDMAFIPWNPINAGNIDELAPLKNVAQRHEATPYQVALSWLLHRAPNILLIPGTSKVKHLEENHKAASIALSDEDMQELEKLRQQGK
ncbi:aldo/keto reductase [Pontibacter actiniarum]|uniref:Oxidoreductase n=1 Tax=Pontibacter actiniarum TaxID=323450 RepID=A0A1X9YNV6_9BACT|nr:aldo/keto reductase [Pontibacter actiniarum]ARS34578.1 oxidoreductase [Pontibacter actiniarum]